MNRKNENKTKQQENKNSSTFLASYYRAEIDSVILFIKSLVILNSSGLASALIFSIRSNDDKIASILTGTSYFFWCGLTCAFICLITFAPESEKIREFQRLSKKYSKRAFFSLICSMSSLVLFLVGTLLLIIRYRLTLD